MVKYILSEDIPVLLIHPDAGETAESEQASYSGRIGASKYGNRAAVPEKAACLCSMGGINTDQEEKNET